MDEIFMVDNNLIIFSSEKPDKSESLTKKARIFYTGTHKGKEYTTEDLDKIVRNFKSEDEIPIQLDHSTSARDTIGKVRKVEREGSELFSNLEFLGKDVVENVRLGKWNKVSVGLKIKHPEMKLQEVSITPFPSLENARVFSQGGGEELKDKAKKEEKVEHSNKEETVSFAQFQAMQAEIRLMKEENARLEETVKMKEDTEIIENFCQEGKTTPAMRDAEIKLFHSLDEAQRRHFMEWKKNQPVLVDYKVYNRKNLKKAGEDGTDEDEKRADQILKYTQSVTETITKL